MQTEFETHRTNLEAMPGTLGFGGKAAEKPLFLKT